MLVLKWPRPTSWECSPNGRTSIAQFFRLYSEPAIHGAQIQVTTNWFACKVYQINSDITMGWSKIRLRKLAVHCFKEELVGQWTEQSILLHVPEIGCLQRFGIAIQGLPCNCHLFLVMALDITHIIWVIILPSSNQQCHNQCLMLLEFLRGFINFRLLTVKMLSAQQKRVAHWNLIIFAKLLSVVH